MAADVPRRLMVIFSVGGLGAAVHGVRTGLLRCQPAVVTLAAVPEIVLDPFPSPGSTGVVAGDRARVMRGDVEVAARSVLAPLSRRRWDDLDVLAFAAATLSAWIVLPAMLDDPAVGARELEPAAGVRRVEVPTAAGGSHVLHVDDRGWVTRHEEDPFVHELSGHCDFGGITVATRRRTRIQRGGRWLPVQWADVVAAHAIPDHPQNPSMEGPELPTTRG